MGNRRLYNSRCFIVKELGCYKEVWHLLGIFTEGSIKSSHSREYRIRVKPDPRWVNVAEVVFHEDYIYECESIDHASRRHIYGSDKWFISPARAGSRWSQDKEEFIFEDFDVKFKE